MVSHAASKIRYVGKALHIMKTFVKFFHTA